MSYIFTFISPICYILRAVAAPLKEFTIDDSK